MKKIFALIFFIIAVTNCGKVTLTVKTNSIIARSSLTYISFNFDWHLNNEEYPAWFDSSILSLDLTNPRLISLAKSLSPAKLRIGGSEADEVIYDIGSNTGCSSTLFCLTMKRWEEIVAFADAAGLDLVFGLNAMNGRSQNSGRFNFTNLSNFLAYTAENRLRVYGFEFGNELQTKVPAEVMGSDYLQLRKIINNYWPSQSSRPKLIGPDENPDESYLATLLKICGSAMDAVTYHMYIGYGLDPRLPEQILEPSFLDQSRSIGTPITKIISSLAPNAEIWVGETAAAWHSGQDQTTNTFLSGFWYLDQLGTLATLGHKGFCRQTLVGGYYELLNKTTKYPNPDYWSALFWHRFMGVGVLSATVDGSNMFRAYAHCSNSVRGGVTLAVINLSSNETFDIDVTGFTVDIHHDYIFTSNSLRSQEMFLNGKQLIVSPSGELPPLDPVISSNPITVKPLSYGYIDIPTAKVQICN